jgi:GT2 family glycosyltransferase
MPDISVVIVNFNSKKVLEECIASLKASSNIPFEVIVVDNASTDGSAEMVRSRSPQVKLIVNSSNLGFIKANNLGIKASKGARVMCLNNDTVVKAGAIEKLSAFMDAHPEAGAVGPKLLNSDGSIQYQCRRGFPTAANSLFYFTGLSRLFPKSKTFSGYLMTYLDDKSVTEVDSLCGAAMLVRREAIDKVGVMDEDYYMYGDDIDWCFRMQKAGWKIFYLPEAEIVHYGGRGGSRLRSFRNIIEFHRSMAVFYKKHYAVGSLFAVNWSIYAAVWLKCSLEIMRNLLRSDKFAGTKKP